MIWASATAEATGSASAAPTSIRARKRGTPPPLLAAGRVLLAHMADFLDSRMTERRNPRTAHIDLATPLEIVDLINAEDATIAAAVKSQRAEIAAAIELAEAT